MLRAILLEMEMGAGMTWNGANRTEECFSLQGTGVAFSQDMEGDLKIWEDDASCS